MLFFTADWCVPCRIMKRQVFADQEVERAMSEQVVSVMVDANTPGGDQLFNIYQVGGTPVTIFTDSRGDVIDYAVGGIGKPEFLELLANL